MCMEGHACIGSLLLDARQSKSALERLVAGLLRRLRISLAAPSTGTSTTMRAIACYCCRCIRFRLLKKCVETWSVNETVDFHE